MTRFKPEKRAIPSLRTTLPAPAFLIRDAPSDQMLLASMNLQCP
jgi:hypothetical protein